MERDFVPRTLDAADPDVGVLSLHAGGRTLSVDDRDKLLADLRGGTGPSRLTLEALVFLQRETPNRNFVRFKPGILKKLANSFAGRPVLRDHEQRDLGAVAGRIVASELVEHKGAPAIAQTLELVKPWAIEAALDGTMSTFSIGWNNTDDVTCSICGEAMARSIFGALPGCSHFPGDKLEGKDGETRYVEMVVTGAEGLEVSAVSVPAVPGTYIGEIRAALATQRLTALHHPPKEKHMKILAQKLGLAESADEAAMLAAVERLFLEKHAADTALAAEQQAHKQAQTELAAVRESERKVATESLLTTLRRKVGKGTEYEAAALSLAEVTLEAAQAWVAKLPQLTGIGQPLLSRGTEPEDQKGALTAQQRRIARSLGVTDDEYAKSNTGGGR